MMVKFLHENSCQIPFNSQQWQKLATWKYLEHVRVYYDISPISIVKFSNCKAVANAGLIREMAFGGGGLTSGGLL
jgi:hypothetical protein